MNLASHVFAGFGSHHRKVGVKTGTASVGHVFFCSPRGLLQTPDCVYGEGTCLSCRVLAFFILMPCLISFCQTSFSWMVHDIYAHLTWQVHA